MSSTFSSEAGEEPTVPAEYDSVERLAEVWLYVSETSGFGESPTYRHWVLVFEFVDKSVRAIEGVNYKGQLLPSFTKMKDRRLRRVSRKGTITISPTRIRELVINNPYNGRAYGIFDCNCQSWLNVILKKLGFDEETTAASDIAWNAGIAALGLIGFFLFKR